VLQAAVGEHGHVDEHHRSHRSGWIRAAVLGANDGLLSTSSLLVGVAAGDATRNAVVLTGIAALFAGAFAMAAGEYSSVSSQRDAEEADLRKEQAALQDHPEAELRELAAIYRDRGVPTDLALQVAEHLHAHDAYRAHARDELGIDPDRLSSPVSAAATSALSFALGALLPLLTMALVSAGIRSAVTIVLAVAALAALGALGARLGGAAPTRAVIRVVALGLASMAATAAIGHIVGVQVA
jgi:vacuolar iron transporter family protein